jgi:co-chaperonin GroES (HSP10)
MKFHPSEDRVLLKPVPPETQTKSGLIIPLEAQKIKMWEVVEVGEQVLNKIVVVGDKITVVQNPEIKIKAEMLVMVPDAAGIDFEEDGQSLRVIRHSSIELYSEKA